MEQIVDSNETISINEKTNLKEVEKKDSKEEVAPVVNEQKKEIEPKKKEQWTFILIKPDAIKRGLMGEIIKRLENKGFMAGRIAYGFANRVHIEELYAEHKTKDFFTPLVDFIVGGPVMLMGWFGENIVSSVRLILGDNYLGPIGSVRGDYASNIRENLMHASDSQEAAKRELKIFFQDPDLAKILDAN